MIIDFLGTKIDGESWEELCNSCYRIRYQAEHYVEIPAVHGGDAGIEGFTSTGIVYQCYCPERDYSDAELHEHLRDKMTKDLNKLTSEVYIKKRAELGVPVIKEWHYVIPFYKDHRIIIHINNKNLEILSAKKATPELYTYIDDSFKIVLKVAKDFRVELTRIIRDRLMPDIKLNYQIRNLDSIDWTKCDSEKVDNIKRKVKAVMGHDTPDSDSDYKEMVSLHIEAYIKGRELLDRLQVDFIDVYEDILELEQKYKRIVSAKTKMNPDKGLNYHLFNEILNDFQSTIEKDFPYLTMAFIGELQIDLISGWLADCSMQFR